MNVQTRYDSQVACSLYREHLSRGNRLRFRATGGSMLPLIRSGDIVHVVAVNRYTEGDILLYERGTDWFVHRFIRRRSSSKNEHELILRGDALPHDDPPVALEAVLGRVVQIERGTRLIQLDSAIGVSFKILSTIPILRYPVLPRVCILLMRVKRRLFRRLS